MTGNEFMERANYNAAKAAILDFASNITPKTQAKTKEGLQRQAFKVVDNNVSNPVLQAELKALYRKISSQRVLEKNQEDICWRKYLAANENHKIPVDDNGRPLIPITEHCMHCEKNPYSKGGTYESKDIGVGFCGNHDSVKGKLEGKV